MFGNFSNNPDPEGENRMPYGPYGFWFALVVILLLLGILLIVNGNLKL